MNFSIEQREVELESTFSPRLWSLVHDVPVLYEALLESLAPVGLSGMDLRPEAGNGSVGGAGLGRFKTHAVSYGCHGLIEGTNAAEFVRQFVPGPPGIEGFGDHLGTGVAFYFGEAAPTISSVLTLDSSQVVHDGLFVHVYMIIDGAVGAGAEMRALAQERVRTALASVNLEIP